MVRVPPGAMDVYVVGKRWMWKAQHMTGQREINELHVPVGVPVKLTLTSEDVIHSFFVPAFRVKKDAIPGRYQTHVVRGHQAGPLPPVLRRVLRHQALGDDRLDRGHGAGGLPGLAGRAGPARSRWRRRASSCFQELGCVTCHRADSEGARPAACRACSAGRSRLAGGGTVHRRRGLHPRVDREPGGQGGGRATSRSCPTYQGLVTRGGPDAARRVRPVARRQRGGARGGEARRRPRRRRRPRSPAPEGRHAVTDRPRPPLAARAAQRTNYLNANYGVLSWLLTTDHKRIAILYLVSDHASMFVLGGLVRGGHPPGAGHARRATSSSPRPTTSSSPCTAS